jgi:Lar family restriction alleviation protein
MNGMKKLKPCPFCGSDDIGIGKATTNFFEERFFVVCDNCGASSKKSKDVWRCVEAWNRMAKE